jgi:hypothetical protein
VTNKELGDFLCDARLAGKPIGVRMSKDGCSVRGGEESRQITTDQAELALWAIQEMIRIRP